MGAWEVDTTKQVWTDEPIVTKPPSKWWHLWFQPLNLAALAFAICVLTGCRDPASVTYKFYSVDASNVTEAMGRNCTACEFSRVPEEYAFGLSGLCRISNTSTSCTIGIATSFNLTAAVWTDIHPSSSNNTSPLAPTDTFPTTGTRINHSQVQSLASAITAFLVISTLISFSAIPLTAWKGPWNDILFPFLAFDTLVLFASVVMMYSIMRQELAGAFAPAYGDIPSDAVVEFGFGAWLLVGLFLARVLCDPTCIVFLLCTALSCGLFLVLVVFWLVMPKGKPRPRFVGYATRNL